MKKLYPSTLVLPGLLIKHYLLYNSTNLFTPKFYFMQKLFTLRTFMFVCLMGMLTTESQAQLCPGVKGPNLLGAKGTFSATYITVNSAASACLSDGTHTYNPSGNVGNALTGCTAAIGSMIPCSDYNYTATINGMQPEFTYSILKVMGDASGSNCIHDPIWIAKDHTNDGGYFMAVNGAPNSSLSPVFYQIKTIPVCIGTSYEFAAWVINMMPAGGLDSAAPNISFIVNGSVIGNSGPIPYDHQWHQVGGSFTATTATVDLQVVNATSVASGNDLGLDDISFRVCQSMIDKSGPATNLQFVVTDPLSQNTWYKWQLSTDGGTSFSDITSGTTATYGADHTFTVSPSTYIGTATPEMNGYIYRLVVSTSQVGLANADCVYFNDYVLIVQPSGGPLPALYFRTHQSGLWSDLDTWEYSTDGLTGWTYTPRASHTPTFVDRTITVQTGHTVTVSQDVMTDETIVQSSGKITINSDVTLSLNDGTDGNGFDLTVDGVVDAQDARARLLIKSVSTGTDAGTASIGPSNGSITVPATVERLISAVYNRSAWRFLTAPLTSTGSIYNTWQNRGVYASGIGTTVTGPTYITATGGTPGSPVSDANGLDYNTAAPSLYIFDVATQTIVPVTDTRITPLSGSANTGYYMFIRGDRISTTATPNQTTLSATGSLQLGTKNFTTSSTANAITLVGNPYASAIDLNKFNTDNFSASNVKPSYYYWDPYLTGTYGVGGYVTVSYASAGGTATIVPLSACATTCGSETQYLQSGQAIFLQTKAAGGSGTVVFNENQKNATSVNNIFRVQSANIDNIRVNLNVINAGTPVLVDGIAASFNNSYSPKVDNYDATKFYNPGESIAFMRDNKALSIERLPLSSDAVLYLNLYKLKENITYQLEINPSINANGLKAYLVDNYLKTNTEIDLGKTTTVNFTINSEAASTGSNRFSISFSKPGVVVAGKAAMSVFPNPVTNNVINLQMSNMPQGIYNVRVFNSMGQVIATKQINHSAGTVTETLQVKGLSKGIYQLEVVKPDNSKFSSKLMTN